MSISFQMEPGETHVIAAPATPLTELSFALSTSAAWMLGRGVYIMRGFVEAEGRNLRVTVRAMIPPRQLAHSTLSTIGDLVRGGHLPYELHLTEQITPNGKTVPRDGNNRVGANAEGTFTNSYDLKPNVHMGTLAFGIGDQFVGNFSMGASVVEWRGSQKIMQYWMNLGMTPTELERYARSPYCYQPTWTAAKIIDRIKKAP